MNGWPNPPYFTYELADGYCSPWLWPTAEAVAEYVAKAHPDAEVSPVKVPEDGEPVRIARSSADIDVPAPSVRVWRGQRGSGDMMQGTATLRLDAGGIRVDVVGTLPELEQLKDRIAAAFDREWR
jgi:hypothetical protein